MDGPFKTPDTFPVSVVTPINHQTTRENALTEVRGRKELQLFLDDPSVAVLCVHSIEGGGFRLSNSLGTSEEQEGKCHTVLGVAEKVHHCGRVIIDNLQLVQYSVPRMSTKMYETKALSFSLNVLSFQKAETERIEGVHVFSWT